MSFRFSAIAAACLSGLALSANAALVRVDFKGANNAPNSVNVFGAPVPFIEGFVVYEDSTPGIRFGQERLDTFNYANAIQQFSFSLGGVFSGERLGSFGSVQAANGANSLTDRLSFNNLIFLPNQIEGEPAGFRQAQLTLALSSDGRGESALASGDLPGLFDPSIFDGQKNITVFLSRTAPAGTPIGQAVSFNFNLTEVRVSDPNAVPEPASLALMGLALAGFAAVRRRRLS